MKGTVLLLLLLVAIAPRTASARVGESPQDLQQRYGPPLSSADLPGLLGVMCRQYQKLDFLVTVYFHNGRSVFELFAKRGLSPDQAQQVVTLVATHPVASLSPAEQNQLRHSTGITSRNEIFWTWTTQTAPPVPVNAAYNPDECTLTFFSDPAMYAQIQQALASAPPAALRPLSSRPE